MGIDNSPEAWSIGRSDQPTIQEKEMEQITIAGKAFNVPLRYAEGHELSKTEANALNQMYHENLRGNFAQKVKSAIQNGSFNHLALQAEFDIYADKYEFGTRIGRGGRTRDPVQTEALSIARSMVDNALRAKGLKPNEVDAAAKAARVKRLVEERPDITELARKRVAEAQSAATDDLTDFVNQIPEKEAAE